MAILGVLAIEDSQKPVPLPVDGAFSVQGKSSKANQEIYKLIDEISDQHKVTIYKPLINHSGKTTYIKLNSKKNNSKRNQLPIVGMYYVSGKLVSKDFEALKSLGLQVTYDTYPWFLGGTIQFYGTLRAILTISLYLVIFIILLVNDSRKLKERVIWRSLGKPIINVRADFMMPLVANFILTFVLEICYSWFVGGGFNTFSSKLFLALLLTNFVIFQVLELLVILIAYINIKLEKPVEIIKNKLKGRGLFLIWLVMIGLLILVSGLVLKESKSTQLTLNSQLASLEPWEKVKDWQKLQLMGIENQQTVKESGQIVDDHEKTSQKYLEILTAIKGTDFFYLRQSSAYLPETIEEVSEVSESFLEQLKKDGISQPDVNKNLIYINQAGAQLENAINQTTYVLTKGKIATIYVPQKFKEAQSSIINTVLAEHFIGTTITKDDLDILTIPNQQKIFYFNEFGDDRQKNDNIPRSDSRASDTNRIVVVLNTDVMLAQKDGVLADNMVNNGLFSPEAVKKIAQLSQTSDFSLDPIAVFQTVALKIQSLKHQLLTANILQKILFVILFVCVYQYTRTLILIKQSEFVKRIILGCSKVSMTLSHLASLVVIIVSATCLTVILTGQMEMLWFGLFLLLTIAVASIRSFLVVKENYTQILKGEVA
jgi:hypothetical protein